MKIPKQINLLTHIYSSLMKYDQMMNRIYRKIKPQQRTHKQNPTYMCVFEKSHKEANHKTKLAGLQRNVKTMSLI